MKKYIAAPCSLEQLISSLSSIPEEERTEEQSSDLAAAQEEMLNFGDIDMTSKEISDREQEEIDNAAATVEAYKDVYYDQKLNGGIEINGMEVKSHEQSRVLINGAVTRALIENDPTRTHDFFAPDGSVIQLSNTEFSGIGLALAQHVQKCLKARASTAMTVYPSIEAFKSAFDTAYE